MTTIDGRDDRRERLSSMRRAIARTMSESAAIPQFTLERTARMDAVMDVRAELRKAGAAVSPIDFVILACARALVRHPELNSTFEPEAIVLHGHVNIGVALALPDGLVSPAILDADQRSLDELALERRRLLDAAQTGALRREEFFGATFTVSNLGPYGVERFQALVVPGQTAILAVGVAQNTPTGLPSLALCLSCDHRAVDGAPAAAFLATVVEALADARSLVVDASA